MAEEEWCISQVDGQAIGDSLGTRPATVRDVAYGEGQLFSAGHGAARLEVFPQTGVTRLTAQDMRVELFGNASAVVSETGVEFHRSQPDQQASLAVLLGGGVVFTFVAGAERPPSTSTPPEELPGHPTPAATKPGHDLETAREPAPDHADNQTRPTAGEVPSDLLTSTAGASATEQRTARPAPTAARRAPPEQPPPAVPDTAGTPPPTGSSTDRATKEQHPRVQLTGRLGRDPSFRTSPRGTLVGRFPLAVHRDDGTTVWHSVLAFGDRAKLLQHRSDAGELAKGQEVNLIGYQHTREQPTRDGHTKTVTEIYAVAITRR